MSQVLRRQGHFSESLSLSTSKEATGMYLGIRRCVLLILSVQRVLQAKESIYWIMGQCRKCWYWKRNPAWMTTCADCSWRRNWPERPFHWPASCCRPATPKIVASSSWNGSWIVGPESKTSANSALEHLCRFRRPWPERSSCPEGLSVRLVVRKLQKLHKFSQIHFNLNIGGTHLCDGQDRQDSAWKRRHFPVRKSLQRRLFVHPALHDIRCGRSCWKRI